MLCRVERHGLGEAAPVAPNSQLPQRRSRTPRGVAPCSQRSPHSRRTGSAREESFMLRCTEGGLAVVIREEPGCEINVGRAVVVSGPIRVHDKYQFLGCACSNTTHSSTCWLHPLHPQAAAHPLRLRGSRGCPGPRKQTHHSKSVRAAYGSALKRSASPPELRYCHRVCLRLCQRAWRIGLHGTHPWVPPGLLWLSPRVAPRGASATAQRPSPARSCLPAPTCWRAARPRSARRSGSL